MDHQGGQVGGQADRQAVRRAEVAPHCQHPASVCKQAPLDRGLPARCNAQPAKRCISQRCAASCRHHCTALQSIPPHPICVLPVSSPDTCTMVLASSAQSTHQLVNPCRADFNICMHTSVSPALPPSKPQPCSPKPGRPLTRESCHMRACRHGAWGVGCGGGGPQRAVSTHLRRPTLHLSEGGPRTGKGQLPGGAGEKQAGPASDT